MGHCWTKISSFCLYVLSELQLLTPIDCLLQSSFNLTLEIEYTCSTVIEYGISFEFSSDVFNGDWLKSTVWLLRRKLLNDSNIILSLKINNNKKVNLHSRIKSITGNILNCIDEDLLLIQINCYFPTIPMNYIL